MSIIDDLTVFFKNQTFLDGVLILTGAEISEIAMFGSSVKAEIQQRNITTCRVGDALLGYRFSALAFSHAAEIASRSDPRTHPWVQNVLYPRMAKNFQTIVIGPAPTPPVAAALYQTPIAPLVLPVSSADASYAFRVVTRRPEATGPAVCSRCKMVNEYAEPSASYICYECRS